MIPTVEELDALVYGPRVEPRAQRWLVVWDGGSSGPFTHSSAEQVAGVRRAVGCDHVVVVADDDVLA